MIKPKIKGYKVCFKNDVWRRVLAEFGPKKASELLPLDVPPLVQAVLLSSRETDRKWRKGVWCPPSSIPIAR